MIVLLKSSCEIIFLLKQYYLEKEEKEEKDDLKEEWYQHLMDRMNDFIQKGISENEAIGLSIKQIGPAVCVKQANLIKVRFNARVCFLYELNTN